MSKVTGLPPLGVAGEEDTGHQYLFKHFSEEQVHEYTERYKVIPEEYYTRLQKDVVTPDVTIQLVMHHDGLEHWDF